MNEIKTKRWFESEVARYGAIIVFFVPITIFFFGIKTDIALIQQSIWNINSNHEAHIQDILSALKDMRQEQLDQEKQIIELQKQMIVILNKR